MLIFAVRQKSCPGQGIGGGERNRQRPGTYDRESLEGNDRVHQRWRHRQRRTPGPDGPG